MILRVEDAEIVEMTTELAELRRESEVEVLRAALKRELRHARSSEARFAQMRKRIAALQEQARKMAGSDPQPVTKEWIDSLYEDD